MFRATLLAVALIVATSSALAQSAPISIRGRVVAAEDSRALRRALVSLAQGARGARAVLTDDEGRFAIDVPDSSSALVIAKAGYASTLIEPDRRAPSSREREVRLARGAVITGRMVERGGLPTVGARMVARRIDDRTFTSAPTFEADTNDLGEYRIGGLPAGQYSVSAMTGPQRVTVVPSSDRETVQGIVTRGASLILGTRGSGPTRSAEVRAGGETSSVDFQADAIEVNVLRPPLPATLGPSPTTSSPQQFTGSINGRVVTPTGEPVGGAVVLMRAQTSVRTLTADADGRFIAGSLPDGDYQIETLRPGNPLPDPRATDTGATYVHLGGDSRVHNVDLVLSRGGVIEGTIVDSAGEPFQGVLVRVLQLRRDAGRMVASMAGWPRLTDDRGRYRVFGLPAGSYLIVATLDATEPASGRSRAPGFAPVYLPGTAHIEGAQSMQVDVGGDITSADMTFAVSSTARVAGTALNAAGDPLVGRVSLQVSRRSGHLVPDPRLGRIESDGSFALPDVPPGDYVVQAIGDAGPGVLPEFGAEYLSVTEGDPPALAIETSAGATLDGRFIADGVSNLPMRAMSIHAAPMDLDRSPATGRGPEGLAVYDDGRFYLTGLHGPMRLTLPNPSPGWYLKSITIGGVDVTDVPFDFGFGSEVVPDAEIVLSSTGGTIAGSIMEEPGTRAAASAVIVFSTRRDMWFEGSRHLKRVSSSTNGSFDVTGLPPGEYWVAVDAVGPGDWQTPDVLEGLVSRSTRVTVKEGQVNTIDLRLNRR